MAEITLNEVYESLSERSDNITRQLVHLTTAVDALSFRVSSIEANFHEVELNNGDDHKSKVSRQQLFQDTYDHFKPGGILDRKFNECKERHSPMYMAQDIERKVDKWWKYGTRIATVITAIIAIILIIDWKKVADHLLK